MNAKPVDEGRLAAGDAAALVRPGHPAGAAVRVPRAPRRRRRGRRPRRPRALEGQALRRHRRTRVTFEDVAGIDEAEDELVEIVDFLKNPDRYRRLGGRDPARRAAVGAARHRQDAAGPRRRGRGGRALLLAVRLGVRRDDRGRRRQPRPRPLRPGEGDRARRSSSSTSSTRSAAPAAARPRSAATTSASRRSTRSSPRWTASAAPRASSCWRPPTGRRSSIPALLRPGRFDRRVVVSPPDRDGRAADPARAPARRAARRRRRAWSSSPQSTPGMVGADLREPDQRGRAHRRAPRPRRGCSSQRLHRGAREDRARGGAPHHALARRARAHGLPRERPRAARDAAARGPTRCARSRSCPAGGRWG